MFYFQLDVRINFVNNYCLPPLDFIPTHRLLLVGVYEL
jgi:hypothetical protein